MRNPVCWIVRRRLDAFHDGELGSPARARTAGHLARCPGCATELATLGRLRAALEVEAPEPPDAVWDAFWPQVRARIAADSAVEVSPSPRPTWAWAFLFGPRGLALGSALAAAVLAVVLFAPWRQPEFDPGRPATSPVAGAPQNASVVVQSVETADPQSSVMVFSNPDADMTVVWVFGLEPTDI